MTIPQDKLDEWRRLIDAATPGPWTKDAGELCNQDSIWSEKCRGYIQVTADVFEGTDKDFIAAAREAVPALLDEVEQLRAAVKVGHSFHRGLVDENCKLMERMHVRDTHRGEWPDEAAPFFIWDSDHWEHCEAGRVIAGRWLPAPPPPTEDV